MSAGPQSIVFAVGEFPPPVTGNSKVTESVSSRLETYDSIHFKRINVSGRSQNAMLKKGQKTLNYLGACLQLAANRGTRARRLYLVCEGRSGLPFTLFLVWFARVVEYEVFLQHHSFGYINQPHSLMRKINASLGAASRHVFLSDGMAEAFFQLYRPDRRYSVGHNLAYIGSFWARARRTTRPRPYGAKALKVGLLSNLEFEKGLDTFIHLADLAAQENLPIEFRLAGPVNSATEHAFLDAAMHRLDGRLHYHGGLYGEDKVQFFRDLDVFVFPTRYYHEAQPIVLHEALAAGCAVISVDRGCIAEDLHAMGGFVVPRERSQDPQAYLELLQPLLADRSELARVRARSLRLTRQRAKEAVEATNRWLNEMVHETT